MIRRRSNSCTQRIEGDYEMSKKASIFAALQLYLDFINIFLYILRLLGRRSSSN